jgi:mono/diheme cytochrome c family protein
MSRVGGLIATALLLAACVTEPTPAWKSGDAAVGHQVAKDNCASCHAVERTGDSPKLGALPFRNILAGYRPDWLADDLHTSQAIAPGRMPVFHFGEGHEYDIIAWMLSIQDAPIREPAE